MKFFFNYKGIYFTSISYRVSYFHSLVLFSEPNQNSIKKANDLRLKDLCNYISAHLDCFVELHIDNYIYYSHDGLSILPFDANDHKTLAWKWADRFSGLMDIERDRR